MPRVLADLPEPVIVDPRQQVGYHAVATAPGDLVAVQLEPVLLGVGRQPGRQVHPVGHVADGHFGQRPAGVQPAKDEAAGGLVQAADRIHRAGAVCGEAGHVEGRLRVVRCRPAQCEQLARGDAQLGLGIAAQVLADAGRGKAVEAGFDRRMRGEQVAGTGRGQRHFEGHAARRHVAARPLEHGKGGMPVVEMAHLRGQPGSLEQAPAADAQHDLLTQAHLPVAAVQLAGDQANLRWVGRLVGVEQQQSATADARLPAANPQLHTGQAKGQAQRPAGQVGERFDRQLPRVVDRVQGLLPAVGIDALAEVAVLPEHAHRDHRHAEVAGGLELVAGDVAQPAGIDRQRLAEHVFHGEVGDAGERIIDGALGEPGRLRGLGTAALYQFAHPAMEFRPAQQLGQLPVGHGAQDQAGVVRQVPEVLVDGLPDVVIAARPADRLIEGQLAQRMRRDRR